MMEIKEVAGTAFIVAEYRAEENLEPNPLYQDLIVPVFLNEATRRAADYAAAPSPEAKNSVKLRTRYFDDVLVQQIRSGCRQVVILGSGLDTRAVRKRAEGVAYFEFDDPSTLQLKKTRYEDHGFEANLTLIPVNYVIEDWIALLKEHHFDFDLPTHFIWEGNTMYLALNDVKAVLIKIRDHVRQATISFDYLSQEVIEKTTGDPELCELVDRLATLGAPWITGIRDIGNFVKRLNIELLENVPTAELHRTYWPERSMNTRFLEFYSVCTLASKGYLA
jgi:methyltransferase (TIGR00027 family)